MFRRHPYLTIIGVIVLSRLALLAVGLQFDLRPLVYFDQTLDPALLHDRLLESLWYCHTQPPLMNFVIGVMLKIFGPSGTAFYLLNVALGLGGACSLYALMRRMRVTHGVSLGLVLLFFLGPACIVTEHQLFYDYPLMCVAAVAGLMAHRFASSGGWRDGLLFFLTLLVFTMTRSLYHPAWILLTALLFILVDRRRWKRTALVALPAILIGFGWYAKNLVLFGAFTSSTWMGANLHAPTVIKIPITERRERIARGEFTPAAFTDDPFLSLDSFQKAAGYRIQPVNSGIPVLDMERRTTGAPNYNNPNYIPIHKDLERDARTIISEQPMLFVRSFMAALVIYCFPPSEVWAFYPSRLKLRPYDRLYNTLVFGQVNYFISHEHVRYLHDSTLAPRTTASVVHNLFHAGLVLLILIPLLTILSVVWWWRAWRRGESVDAAVLGHITVMLLFTATVGNLMSVAENSRYRFVVDPYYLLLTGMLWMKLRTWWRRRRFRGGEESEALL